MILDDKTVLPASYTGSVLVSDKYGVKVTFHFDDADEAGSWHDAVTDEQNAAESRGDYEVQE